jgi:hypothetical protein
MFRNQGDFKAHKKENIVKVLLAAALVVAPLTSFAIEEKEEFKLKMNDQGEWCGKFYSNYWNNKKRYQCRTQEEWEAKKVRFPEEMRDDPVIIGPPILGGEEGLADIRG